jgi:threonine aldolase
MRQVGIIAAAGLIALTEMPSRLAEDHARAKKLAKSIAGLPGVRLNPEEVETNIIIFGFDHPRYSVPAFLAELAGRGIGVLGAPSGAGIRMVTHKDIDDADVEAAVAAFRAILAG